MFRLGFSIIINGIYSITYFNYFYLHIYTFEKSFMIYLVFKLTFNSIYEYIYILNTHR